MTSSPGSHSLRQFKREMGPIIKVLIIHYVMQVSGWMYIGVCAMIIHFNDFCKYRPI